MLVDSARVIIVDIEAANGLIHAIDNLLIPKAVLSCNVP